jgi:hypothetical protein
LRRGVREPAHTLACASLRELANPSPPCLAGRLDSGLRPGRGAQAATRRVFWRTMPRRGAGPVLGTPCLRAARWTRALLRLRQGEDLVYPAPREAR